MRVHGEYDREINRILLRLTSDVFRAFRGLQIFVEFNGMYIGLNRETGVPGRNAISVERKVLVSNVRFQAAFRDGVYDDTAFGLFNK